MKKFFGEFKKFITRGNVLDMAVGVIVGGAFTAIVNGMSNFVLKPIINWLLSLILGKNSLSEVYTFLGTPAYTYTTGENGQTVKTIDLANSFYIDWGSLINAIINFLIIAFVLFSIVKIINKTRENNEKLKEKLKGKLTKEDKKILKSRGIKLTNREQVKTYIAEREANIKAEQELAKKQAEEKAKQDRLENPTVEDLLKDIKALLQKEKKKEKTAKKKVSE